MSRMSRLSAFTLIELLTALAILTVISGLGVISFSSIRRSSEAGARAEERSREVRSFLNRLDVELSGAVQRRDEESTFFSSSREPVGAAETSTLSFATISPQVPYELIERGEVIRVEYLVRQHESGDLVLVKRLWLNIHAVGSPDPVEFPVIDEVDSFLLRFSKGNTWHDDWNPESMGGLPESVELTFEAGGRSYRERFNLYMAEL
jgi:type II secretion system protein J